MKKVTLFIIAVFLIGVNCFAQNVSKFKTLRDNIAKNDAATQHPKKGIDPKTWMERGKLFYDAYNVNVGVLRAGMQTVEAKLLLVKPPKQVTATEDGNEVYEYSQITLYFENGGLKTWVETEKVVDNALKESASAYLKARELDVKDKNEKKITDALTSINRDLESKFFNEYFLAKYPDAYNTALERIELNNYMGVTDTVYYFYAGYAAYSQSDADSSMWNQSIDYFEKALSFGYREVGESQGQIYSLLFAANKKTGNLEMALKYAQTGFEKHPTYTQLMYDLINYYLERSENEQALEYLEQAVARDPENPRLLFAQGKVLDELGEPEKSIASYNAAIAIDPDYFDVYYNKAVVIYNSAVKFNDLANEARTQADYEKYKNQADEEFYKAIEPMEKAYQLHPEETSTIEILKSLYLRLRVKYPEFEAKFEEMDKILKEMQK